MKAITIKKLVIETGLPNRALREQEVRLYNAAKNGDGESIQIIFNQGEFNINSKHEFNWTPLHVATNRNHISVIKILLNREDLEPLSIDSAGKTALHLAANNRNAELVKILAPRIPIHIKDHSGETPLHIASKNNYADTIQFLLNAGADANALDHKGNTALHSAALNGRIISLECLLKSNININVKNAENQTAFDIAANRGYIEFIKILLEHGCSIPNNIDLCPDLYNTGVQDIEKVKLRISSIVDIAKKADDVFNNIIQKPINIPPDLTTIFLERFKWHLKEDYWINYR